MYRLFSRSMCGYLGTPHEIWAPRWSDALASRRSGFRGAACGPPTQRYIRHHPSPSMKEKAIRQPSKQLRHQQPANQPLIHSINQSLGCSHDSVSIQGH